MLGVELESLVKQLVIQASSKYLAKSCGISDNNSDKQNSPFHLFFINEQTEIQYVTDRRTVYRGCLEDQTYDIRFIETSGPCSLGYNRNPKKNVHPLSPSVSGRDLQQWSFR